MPSDWVQSANPTFAAKSEPGSYYRVREPLSDEWIFMHLAGVETVGLYQLEVDNSIKWACLDFDGHSPEEIRAAEDDAFKAWDFINNQEEFAGAPILERSGSKGAHVWLPFDEPISARYGRVMLGNICKKLNFKDKPEIFPKQDELKGEDPTGNLVKGPFGIHKKSGKWSELLQPESLDQVKPVEIDDAFRDLMMLNHREVMERTNQVPLTVKSQKIWGMYPCFKEIKKGVDSGFRDEAMFALARQYRGSGLESDEAWLLLSHINSKNRPPLSEEVIRKIFHQAYGKEYGFSCKTLQNSSVIGHFCGREKCPIYRPESALDRVLRHYREGGA